ncbi:hypothetical protein [Pseudoduganella chitinolytica]|uniref:Uncharacterized protein n=1 Tax=Pseudoduganella chitinolytica TaxID=34070 RepID=A0ABY8BG92_9BURK|nr:hypothetical protein [Pseudoduganella chitinolytica]WEF34323.1 hypothetical protein PX653_05995 [Pseudoduganella chitinolytica]
MIHPLKQSLLALAMLAGTTAAQAGSPDGLNIAAVADETALPYVGAVKQFVADHAASSISCGEYALNLANVYTTDLPPQLTAGLALAAIKDKAKRKKLGKVLTGYRDKTIDRGFDGALAYEVKAGQLRFYGISGASDEKVVVSTLPVADAASQKKVNVAACKALASLPVLAEP